MQGIERMKRAKENGLPDWAVDGSLVAFHAGGGRGGRMLDGFYRPGPAAHAPLLIFVHGMGSNFYRSALKKAFLSMAPLAGLGILSFNNRGAERGTEDEKFRTCLSDMDAAAEFARRHGHRKLVLAGHSTGCQKIAYWQARRRHHAVAGLVFLAPADDYAVLRRDLGKRFDAKVAWARKQVAKGRGHAQVSGLYERFTAERFLSVASERAIEANIFRYEGRLTHFRRIRDPILAVFGENEEFSAIPPQRMLEILRGKTSSADFDEWLIPETGHSFKGCETELANSVCGWAKEVST